MGMVVQQTDWPGVIHMAALQAKTMKKRILVVSGKADFGIDLFFDCKRVIDNYKNAIIQAGRQLYTSQFVFIRIWLWKSTLVLMAELKKTL